MGRILCFDYGLKRIGVAVTDNLRIISTPLVTCRSAEIFDFIYKYTNENEVDLFLVGMPYDLKGNPTDSTKQTIKFIEKLNNKYPCIKTDTYDERYTSKIAKDSLIMMGKNKKYRRKKSNIDKISASIILQSYLISKK